MDFGLSYFSVTRFFPVRDINHNEETEKCHDVKSWGGGGGLRCETNAISVLSTELIINCD